MHVSEIVELKFFSNDLDMELTIREYLRILLRTLWDEEDGFSGKRPFGNSCWQHELYDPLVRAGIIDGNVDDEYDGGRAWATNTDKAHEIIQQVIDYIFNGE